MPREKEHIVPRHFSDQMLKPQKPSVPDLEMHMEKVYTKGKRRNKSHHIGKSALSHPVEPEKWEQAKWTCKSKNKV